MRCRARAAFAVAGDARLVRHIGEGAVAVVVVEHVLAEVTNEKIVEAVIVIIADADSLPPAVINETSLGSYIREGAVAIILKQVRGGLLAGRKTFQPPAVHQKNIQPSVVVEIIKRDPAACGFEEIFVLVFAAVDRFGIESSGTRHIDEACSQGILRRPLRGGSQSRRRQSQNSFERKDQRGTAQRMKERAA